APSAGVDEALAHRWRHDRAGVDQQLCARRAGEELFSVRVEAVAKGARAPFKKSARQLVIYYGELEGLSDIERESRRKELQEIMKKLDARPNTTALSRRGPVRNTA